MRKTTTRLLNPLASKWDATVAAVQQLQEQGLIEKALFSHGHVSTPSAETMQAYLKALEEFKKQGLKVDLSPTCSITGDKEAVSRLFEKAEEGRNYE